MSPSRRNILLISLDDAVAFWKYKTAFSLPLSTPNLDRICNASTSFHAAYCQAPVCSPSRASFMSGLSPHQTGVTGRDAHYFKTLPPEKMWPFRLKENGFFCSSGGKVMRGFIPLPPDIHEKIFSDKPRKFRQSPRPRDFPDRKIPDHVSYGGFRGGLATVTRRENKRLYDNKVANSAIDFLKTYDKPAPFYREVGFSSPHGPWITPKFYKEMYDFKKFRPPAAWQTGFTEEALPEEISKENFMMTPERLRVWRQSVRNYFSAFSHVDYQIGRVWDTLKASPHAENTMVVIVSDHGLHLGDKNRLHKLTLWEQATNVPLIIHEPEQSQGQIVNDPVGLIDLGPTVLDYLGLPPIEASPGHSLLPQMRWETRPDRAVPTFLEGSSAIRKGRYRYIEYSNGKTQLYDLAEDWWQMHELGQDHPAYGTMKDAHKECCREYGKTGGTVLAMKKTQGSPPMNDQFSQSLSTKRGPAASRR